VETAPSVLEIGALLLGAVAAGWVARRLGLPAVVGYLALGVAVSPFTPGFVADRDQLQLLADVGVVLLLFEVGIEVDVWRLRREHGRLAWAAPLQVALTTAITAAVVSALGIAPTAAVVLGLAIALSSSVVIVNITRSRRRTTDHQTEVALLGWSIVQDVAGVVLAAVVLATVEGEGRTILGSLAGFGAYAVLAAFIGGLAITEDPVSREARRQLLPFRDLFAVLFFVAIGALIDPGDLAAGAGWLALFLVLIVGAKVVPAYLIARLAAIGDRPLQLAVGLGQVGEFSFVLAALLAAAGAIGSQVYVAMIAAVAVSIGASTILVRLVPRPASPDLAAAA
jgi:CPA2 family monovalent cation:H+ antiporter-2